MSMQITHENAPFRSAFWSLGAVFAGFASIAVLSTAADMLFHAIGVFPSDGTPSYETGPFLLAFGYRAAFGVLAGYITARLAPHHPMGHALALGVIGLILSTVGAVVMWGMGPNWYAIAVALLAIPAAWLGAVIHSRRATTR